jgi:hypothetical protein
MKTHEQVEDLFKYHEPSKYQASRMGAVGDKAKKLCHLILDKVPDSADRTHAIRLLKDCVMWCNGAISREAQPAQCTPLVDCQMHHVPKGPAVFGGCETSADPLRSFDAVVWAKAFVETVEKNGTIPLDRETMTTWFANALMRGWDERVRRESQTSAA